mmetsp:Transcript_112638/g.323695  ORF Transcript_112638/g.323695 Transcript_112638/m.323695 type:complete len:304 (-) Transcript_112638:306-1217(-)
MVVRRQAEVGGAHKERGGRQQRAAPKLIHDQDGHASEEHLQAHHHEGGGVLVVHTGALADRVRVHQQRIDAAELHVEHDANTDHQGLLVVAERHFVTRRGEGGRGVSLVARHERFLLGGAVPGAEARQRGLGGGSISALREPLRRLRHRQHPEQHRRQCGPHERELPPLAEGVALVLHHGRVRAHDVHEQDARRHRKLVGRAQAATELEGRDFADVTRRDRAAHAHGNADQHARGRKRHRRSGDARGEPGRDVRRRCERQGLLPADPVADPGTREGANDGADVEHGGIGAELRLGHHNQARRS